MADYDVQALSLTTPPQAAPVSTYRPAVRVRNNGIHPANVAGTCRQYRREPPGDLLATWSLSLLNLPAGNEGDALADGYWTPVTADIGREFLFIADVTTEHDQVESNNHLAPVTVLVTTGEPPPPPEVQAHAPQHEAGGSDQVNVDGLHGQLSDNQPPDLHKTNHQAGGPDQLDVTGLYGVLATPQPVELHGYHHQHSEDDEINVNELHGTLADPQPPDTHTATEHDTSVEATEHKGAPNGYPPLDQGGVIPAQYLGPTTPAAHHSSHEPGGADPVTGVPASPHQLSHQAGQADALWVDGLQGVLANPQTPVSHSSSKHDNTVEATANKGQVNGYCELDAGSLIPIARIPAGAVANHHTNHENGGPDELSIAGLSGKAADAQDPTTHGNAAHSVTFEDQANKGGASGYCPLGADTKVPGQYLPSVGGSTYVKAADVTEHVYSGQGEYFLFDFDVAGLLSPGDIVKFHLSGIIDNPTVPNYLTICVKRVLDAAFWYHALLTPTCPQDPASYAFNYEGRLACAADKIVDSCNFFSLTRACNTAHGVSPWSPADHNHLFLELVLPPDPTFALTSIFAQIIIEKLPT